MDYPWEKKKILSTPTLLIYFDERGSNSSSRLYYYCYYCYYCCYYYKCYHYKYLYAFNVLVLLLLL